MYSKDRILVHACCASCSSYVIPLLQENYRVSAFFYNPNIYPEREYTLRLEEMKSLCVRFNVSLITGPYNTSEWSEAVSPYKKLPEKSKRCWECYNIRLDKTAEKASELGIGLFTTTLSVSPHKIYKRIVEGGIKAGERYGVTFHSEDFKKRDGFKISVQRSKQLNLTRQNYCGCILSLKESQERRGEKHDNEVGKE